MTEKPPGEQRQRIDKWLFFTRIARSRALAQDLVEAGFVRLNGQTVLQSSRMVRVGDRIEVQLERQDRILVVRAPGSRRGPFEEARLLYDDLTPPQPPLTPFERAQRRPGSG
ncbi:RNA-binding S4 domain-containing protein [Rhizobium sp. CSW-27]|uniref:RNA-binding S4 domain-containing protein n=1 Tax=Rhizobium sp. CSW-27 TaxID=2839985 RepID=UPI001C0324AC|nr:RNA-binding S4 domain-containing protein [Rhizobium sp. CSW-27]MBT9370592.1 RNA-binding S4 domain-containing protein [Rhizobium sp. CSW-27]